jgi:hypothetical protein
VDEIRNHKRNLANNIGGGGRWELTCVLGILFYKSVKFERGENWSHKTQVFHFLFSVYFLFAIIQYSNQKTIPTLKNIIEGGIFPPCPLPSPSPPQVTAMSEITYKISFNP